jgi:hypothetical protein
LRCAQDGLGDGGTSGTSEALDNDEAKLAVMVLCNLTHVTATASWGVPGLTSRLDLLPGPSRPSNPPLSPGTPNARPTDVPPSPGGALPVYLCSTTNGNMILRISAACASGLARWVQSTVRCRSTDDSAALRSTLQDGGKGGNGGIDA